MEKNHQQELDHFCRVCAKIIRKGYKHKCSESGTLLKCFSIDVASDDCNIHPSQYCHNCHSTAKRLEKAGGVAESSLQAHTWSPHTDNECEVCCVTSALHSAGRKKKDATKRGRPKKESRKAMANDLLKNAPESWKVAQPLSLSRFLPPASNVSLTDFQCAICMHVVDQPIETPCRKLLCVDCISTSLLTEDHLNPHELPCPSCKECHSLTTTSFTPASEFTLKILGGLLLSCDHPLCSAIVSLKFLKLHVQSGCKVTETTFSPSKLTIGQIISRPLLSPPTSAEQKAAANVVKRLIQTSPATGTTSVVKLTTEGHNAMAHKFTQKRITLDFLTLFFPYPFVIDAQLS